MTSPARDCTVTSVGFDDSSDPVEHSHRMHSTATTGLFVLALIFAAHFAAPVIIPITVGFLLSMILATPVARLVSWRIPRPLASGLMISLVILSLGFPVVMLSEPVGAWIGDMPNNASELAERIKTLTVPIQDMRDVAEEVEKLATQLDVETTDTTVVKVESPSLVKTLVDGAPRLVASAIFSIFLAHLLLCSGDAMLRKIITLMCNLRDQRRSLVITRHIQRDLFRYLSAVVIVNVGLGLSTAAILWMLGIPNALFWGGLAGLLNFAPLVGPAVTIAVLTIVGLTTFDSLGQALLVPAFYFVLTSIESQLVSPTFIGRRLALSPVVVLIALVFLGWLWGIAGLLLAVPLVSSARIIFTNIPQLDRVAMLLGR